MRKSKLSSGIPILIIKTNHYVKLTDFCVALTDHFYSDRQPFDKQLTKTDAKIILNHQLFFHGLQGEYFDGFFEAAAEASKERNAIYADAKKWVIKNYPYLNTKS